jgi:hypothetical protein
MSKLSHDNAINTDKQKRRFVLVLLADYGELYASPLPDS